MGLKEQVKKLSQLSEESQYQYLRDLILKYYDHAYRMGAWDVKKAQDRRRKYNNDHEDEFMRELENLRNKVYIKDEYLRNLNRAMPDSVQRIRAMLRLRLQDIADMTKEEADAYVDGAHDLRALVYRIVQAVDDKIPEQAEKEKKKIQMRKKSENKKH